MKLHETKSVAVAGASRIVVLDQEFQDSGSLVREQRCRPVARGRELELEQRWYLNDQARERQDYVAVDGRTERRETRYHDNGR
ncbi:MAG: hypothetical protein ABI156_13130 [Caldimonas sp.]